MKKAGVRAVPVSAMWKRHTGGNPTMLKCGADRMKALHRVEAPAKRIYPTVMHELLCMAERQRALPSIGLRE